MDSYQFFKVIFGRKTQEEFIEIRVRRNGGFEQRFFGGDLETAIQDAVKYAKACSEAGADVYFGVCPRSKQAGTNDAVKRGLVFWADIDTYDAASPEEGLDLWFKKLAIPPHLVVSSGHGFHAYWLVEPFEDFALLKQVGTAVMGVIGGAPLNDAARILRVPDTYNFKDKNNPRPVQVVYVAPVLTILTLQDLLNSADVTQDLINVLHTGDLLDKPSRSERDFVVIQRLYAHLLSKDAIRYIFDVLPVGERHREDSDRTEYSRYFDLTYKNVVDNTVLLRLEDGKIRAVPIDTITGVTGNKTSTLGANLPAAEHSAPAGQVFDAVWGILEIGNCYYALTSDNSFFQLSTFVLKPTLLLSPFDENDGQDRLICDVISGGNVWHNISFPKSAFDKSDSLLKVLTKVQWQWFGQDRHVRKLLPFLVHKLEQHGMPQCAATSVLGRHNYRGKTYFVAKNCTLGEDAALLWVDPQREHPEIVLKDYDKETVTAVMDSFLEWYFLINVPHVVWVVLGWTMASLLKPVIEACGWRFPILNLFGTRGAGKTSLLLKVLQPLVGYAVPAAYDSDTTPFVMRVLLGSTNCILVSFSEHRQYSPNSARLIRNILLAYDSSKDSRGTSQQTTIRYNLSAPITVDGEDPVTDPAGLERVVQVNLKPETIREGTVAYTAFQVLSERNLHALSRPLIEFSLKFSVEDVRPLLEAALFECQRILPLTLPDRVRRNLSICLMGMRLFTQFVESFGRKLELPSNLDEILRGTLENVVDLETGRTRLLVDDFVEDAIVYSALNPQHRDFVWTYSPDENIFYLNVTSAYNWWKHRRRLQGESYLNLTAIKAQLNERRFDSAREEEGRGQYIVVVKAKTIRRMTSWCHGIDLSLAKDVLDIPDNIVGDDVLFPFSQDTLKRGEEVVK